MKWFRRLQSVRQLPWRVLGVLIVVAVVFIGLSLFGGVTWDDVFLNFGTDMLGAVVIYLLLEIVVGRRQEKENLIKGMGSRIKEITIPAVEELTRAGWLVDGSLEGAYLWKANLERAFLAGADLRGADLEEANLFKADLGGAILTGADLGGADLRGAFLTGADLRGANLEETDLAGANLFKADLGGTNLEGADLRGAYLADTNLAKAYLWKADLREANLSEAKYNKETEWPDGFDPIAVGAKLVDKKESPT